MIRSKISATASGLEVLPERLWKRPDVPEYGRPARVSFAKTELLPGEVLSVVLDPRTEL